MHLLLYREIQLLNWQRYKQDSPRYFYLGLSMVSVIASEEVWDFNGIANGGFQSSGEGDVSGRPKERIRELSGVMGTVWMAAWGAA